MTTHPADAVRVVCSYCVQWGCGSCGAMADWPNCCAKAQTVESKPFWPDGSVAVLTQDKTCPRCARAIDEYIGWEQSDGNV